MQKPSDIDGANGEHIAGWRKKQVKKRPREKTASKRPPKKKAKN